MRNEKDNKTTGQKETTMLQDCNKWTRQAHRMIELGGWSGRLRPGQLLYLWAIGMSPGDAAVNILDGSGY